MSADGHLSQGQSPWVQAGAVKPIFLLHECQLGRAADLSLL